MTATTGSGPLDAVLGRLGRVKRSGAGYVACCPAHDDHQASLSVKLGDSGKVLVKCFAGCQFDAIVEALGMQPSDLFPDEVRVHVNGHAHQPKNARLTLAELAAHKRLPIAFLASLGWADADGRVLIPYCAADGSLFRWRYRTALVAKEGSRWGPGEGLIAYEPDRGALRAAENYVVLVEGETDVATLLYAGFPVIGVPGADNTKVLERRCFEGCERVFLVHEPDAGGQTFAKGVRARLVEHGLELPLHELVMPSGAKDPSGLYQRDPDGFKEAFAKLMRKADGPVYRLLSDFVQSCLKPIGERFETGFRTLDEALRGGLPRGRVVVLAGAPGAAKTSFATQLADRWERSGCAVVYLAADEPAEGIAVRLGQLSGFSRDGLETEGDIGDAVRSGFSARAHGRRLVLLDPDEEGSPATIEEAEAVARHLGGDGPCILIVDSLQTARCLAAEGAESAKAAIEAKMRVLKGIAKRGVLVIAISEMARSGYRANNPADNVSALAAGKESGAIEYGAALLLGLRAVRGEVGQVDIEVAKNRLGGQKPRLRIQLDADRAHFSEIALPSAEEQSSTPTADGRMERAKERVLSAVREHRLTSVREVLSYSDGSRSDNHTALQMLEREGRVVKIDGVYRCQEGTC